MPHYSSHYFGPSFLRIDDVISGGPLTRNILITGTTTRCIIADQFQRLKKGDRFFYENADQPSSFTKGKHKFLQKHLIYRIRGH